VSETVFLHPLTATLGKYVHTVLWWAGLRNGFFLDELELDRPEGNYPLRLGNAQALMGLGQLNRLQENLSWRRRLATMYEGELAALGSLVDQDWSNHAALRYTFMVDDRAAWEAHLSDVIDPGTWFTSVVHGRDAGFELVGYEIGSCPAAETAARHCVNLPTHPRVRKPQLVMDLLHAAQNRSPEKLRIRRPGAA
jgi:dTDP-4-amino-4,6-dideoxygalactose transaminase